MPKNFSADSEYSTWKIQFLSNTTRCNDMMNLKICFYKYFQNEQVGKYTIFFKLRLSTPSRRAVNTKLLQILLEKNFSSLLTRYLTTLFDLTDLLL